MGKGVLFSNGRMNKHFVFRKVKHFYQVIVLFDITLLSYILIMRNFLLWDWISIHLWEGKV